MTGCLARAKPSLETVNLDEVLLGYVVGHQERGHILALVALQLYDLPQLRVLHNCAVAAELCTIVQQFSSCDLCSIQELSSRLKLKCTPFLKAFRTFL